MTDGTPEQPPAPLLQITKKRTLALVFMFGFWSLLIVLRLAQIMILDRPDFIIQMEQASWVHGTIPAMRGRLLDIDGRQLAWSSRHFRLLWDVPVESSPLHAQWNMLGEAFPEWWSETWPVATVLRRHGKTLVLKDDLSPKDFSCLASLPGKPPQIRTDTVFRRHRFPNPRVQRIIGEVRMEHGMEVGVSGEELTHDSLLRGRPGLYRVMTNPRGEWIPETWEKLQNMQPGYDVYLPLRVQPVERTQP